LRLNGNDTHTSEWNLCVNYCPDELLNHSLVPSRQKVPPSMT
jgi:hypothetical protein